MKELDKSRFDETLADKVSELQKALDQFPKPRTWLEEDCEDSSRDIRCDNFAEVNNAIHDLKEKFAVFQQEVSCLKQEPSVRSIQDLKDQAKTISFEWHGSVYWVEEKYLMNLVGQDIVLNAGHMVASHPRQNVTPHIDVNVIRADVVEAFLQGKLLVDKQQLIDTQTNYAEKRSLNYPNPELYGKICLINEILDGKFSMKPLPQTKGSTEKYKMSNPCPCDDCFNNFHNNEYAPCDQNAKLPHCKTLENWKKTESSKK